MCLEFGGQRCSCVYHIGVDKGKQALLMQWTLFSCLLIRSVVLVHLLWAQAEQNQQTLFPSLESCMLHICSDNLMLLHRTLS